MRRRIACGGLNVRHQFIVAAAWMVVGWLAHAAWDLLLICASAGGCIDDGQGAYCVLGSSEPSVIPPVAWTPAATAPGWAVPTKDGFFARIREWGYQPRTIIDVGANDGAWAKVAWADFGADKPDPPRLLMVEASPSRESNLAAAGFPFAISVVGRKAAYVDFFDNPRVSTGNSVLRERSHHFASTNATRVPMRTLDEILSTAPGGPGVAAPVILKLDVQGYEIEVLRGAPRTLEAVEVVALETSVIEYNAGAPLIAEVMSVMHELGFVVADLLEAHDHNGALAQLDFAFVKRGSQLLERAAAAAQLTHV